MLEKCHVHCTSTTVEVYVLSLYLRVHSLSLSLSLPLSLSLSESICLPRWISSLTTVRGSLSLFGSVKDPPTPTPTPHHLTPPKTQSYLSYQFSPISLLSTGHSLELLLLMGLARVIPNILVASRRLSAN